MSLDEVIRPVAALPVTGKFHLSHVWCLVCDPIISLCGLTKKTDGMEDTGFHCPACEELAYLPCPRCGAGAVFE